jgi:methylated-DNA-[protein]-cysteine S-methyltransferase
MNDTTDPTDALVQRDLERSAPAPTPVEARALHQRLEAAAEAEDLLDVAYRTLDSPLGSLLVAVTPRGLVRLAFELEHHDAVLESLAETVSPRVLRSGRRTDDVARQLDEYFAGDRRAFDIPVDLQLVRGFRRAVTERLLEVGYGSTVSYAALAARADNPKAVRAVGSACSHNPIPLVVPCHRVVRSDGSTGQYRGGAEAKVALLALESQGL